MRTRAIRVAICGGVIGVVTLVDAAIAGAQLVQSDAEPDPAPPEVTQLVTSSTEVRRAVIGLLSLAVVAGLLGVLYWYKTGQQARDRHTRQFGGRHQDTTRPQRKRGRARVAAANSEPDGQSVAPDAPREPAAVGARDVALVESSPSRRETTLPTWGGGPGEPGRPPSGRPPAQEQLLQPPSHQPYPDAEAVLSQQPYPDAEAVLSQQPYPDAVPQQPAQQHPNGSKVANLRRDLFGQ